MKNVIATITANIVHGEEKKGKELLDLYCIHFSQFILRYEMTDNRKRRENSGTLIQLIIVDEQVISSIENAFQRNDIILLESRESQEVSFRSID